MSSSWNWPGSRWWRVDLHAHSPASYDFGSPLDRENPDWEGWVRAVGDAGVEAIAVTDHNTAGAVQHLQDVVATKEDLPAIFPGAELTASDGTHLLLLLDPSRTQQHVEELLSKVRVTVAKRGQKVARSSSSVEDILDVCGDDVLVIGAHVNGPNGLLGLSGEQRIAVLQHKSLAAVEVDPNKESDNRWLNGNPQVGRQLSQIWASDGHGHDELGQRFTWVKMTRPDLDGLRLALSDGSDSLQPALRDGSGDLNTCTDLAIESITINKGKFIGQSSPAIVRFNPWLNAIIGGRGTGKSTLVDFCRKALRREDELNDSDSTDEGSLRSVFDRRMRVPKSRNEEGLLSEETCIEVVYRKDGVRFLLTWRQNNQRHSIERIEEGGKIPEEGNANERFPVRVYNQKQLFELAQHPNALLSVIDDSQLVDGIELSRSINQKKTEYLSLCAATRAARNQAKELPVRRASLRDVQRKLNVLKEGKHAQVVSEYGLRRQQNETWTGALHRASQSVEAVGNETEKLVTTDLNIASDGMDNEAMINLKQLHEMLNQKIVNFRLILQHHVKETLQGIEELQNGKESLQWRETLAKIEGQYREALTQLEEEGISEPNEHDKFLEQESKLKEEVIELTKAIERVQRLEKEARDKLEEYRQLRTELSERRIRFAGATSGETLHVEIEKLSNYQNLGNELGDILGIIHFEEDREATAKRIRPIAGQSWDWGRLDTVVTDIRSVGRGESVAWNTSDRRFKNALVRMTPESADRLALYWPEDTVAVNFYDERIEGWKSLAQGSPGQQTAALLTFVLGYGSEPIILDQPEDDLDNTLIYELLVDRLRKTKPKRQVIVVTHNPNIVVHGDAEFVISLVPASGESRIGCQGGLQEREIRDEICRIMEGGREAFERRYRRIIPD